VLAQIFSRMFGWIGSMLAKLFSKVLFPWVASSARHALAAGLVSAANHTLGATTTHAKSVGAVTAATTTTPSFLRAKPGAPAPTASRTGSSLEGFLGSYGTGSFS
jgi:L-lactate permease